MRLTFLGAAGEVTGANFLLANNQTKILIDCGLFQGSKEARGQNEQPFDYDPKTIAAVFLTHAHLDHCGRLPKLWKDGYRGKIYSTPATRELAELIMDDAAEIMLHEQDDRGQTPLYSQIDVANCLSLFEDIEYHSPIDISSELAVEFYDAGHILGSSSILIKSSEGTVVFSGDIGNHPVPILREPENPKAADVVVMEATYGNREHESSVDRRNKLRFVIKQSIAKNGVLLIPAFALERTQEILYELRELLQAESIPAVPIFLDSPLASKATRVYSQYTRYYDTDAAQLARSGIDFLHFPNLKITESVPQSKAINETHGPKIIIAGSGMLEGGRITHHALRYLPLRSTTLLFVGYQAKGTLGRELFEGRRRVRINGKMINVKAHVVAIGAYSAHADQRALIDWLSHISEVKKVYLIHGEAEESEALRDVLLPHNYEVYIPKLNQSVEI